MAFNMRAAQQERSALALAIARGNYTKADEIRFAEVDSDVVIEQARLVARNEELRAKLKATDELGRAAQAARS